MLSSQHAGCCLESLAQNPLCGFPGECCGGVAAPSRGLISRKGRCQRLPGPRSRVQTPLAIPQLLAVCKRKGLAKSGGAQKSRRIPPVGCTVAGPVQQNHQDPQLASDCPV